jgi:hypothetical protein
MSKIIRAKMNWKCGSSGRAPALQVSTLKVRSLEFKPQSHRKKKKQQQKLLMFSVIDCPDFEAHCIPGPGSVVLAVADT